MSTDRRTIAYWKNVATQSYRQMEIYKGESKYYKRLYENEKRSHNYTTESRNTWMEIADLRSGKRLSDTRYKYSHLTVSYRSDELIKLQLESEKKELEELKKQHIECVFITLNPNTI